MGKSIIRSFAHHICILSSETYLYRLTYPSFVPNILLEIFILAEQRFRYNMVEVHAISLQQWRVWGVR